MVKSTNYTPKLKALFNENNEFQTQKNVSNSKAISQRLRLNKQFNKIERVTKECKCYPFIDKNAGLLAIEGENPKQVQMCIQTLNVMYGFKELRHITLTDDSTIAFIGKQSTRKSNNQPQSVIRRAS